ncbi:MAG: GNAT family N-acetyltransferase [Bacteroidota bacterium]
MIQVEIALSNQSVLEKIIDLRYEILRKPWDKSRETATDDLEFSSVNAYILLDKRIVACGRLQDNGMGVGQIRYMAVHTDYQGNGLGKMIVLKLEEEARKLGLVTIELQARENAIEFYKRQKYILHEKSFKLWDIIQHYLMLKKL